jgi:rubrerythrin
MKDKTEILGSLAHNEELVGELYRTYSRRFPEMADFWTGLAEAEKRHSTWLIKLSDAATEKTLTVTDRFSTAAVTTFHNYLIKETTAAGRQDYGEKLALTTALYIEKSLIEKDFYQSVSCTDEVISNLLEGLVAESRQHLELIRQKMRDKGLKPT